MRVDVTYVPLCLVYWDPLHMIEGYARNLLSADPVCGYVPDNGMCNYIQLILITFW